MSAMAATACALTDAKDGRVVGRLPKAARGHHPLVPSARTSSAVLPARARGQLVCARKLEEQLVHVLSPSLGGVRLFTKAIICRDKVRALVNELVERVLDWCLAPEDSRRLVVEVTGVPSQRVDLPLWTHRELLE